MMSEEMQMIPENQKATGLVEMTEAETDRVAGGDNGKHLGELKNGDDGNHFGQTAKGSGVPAWTLNDGKAADAPGHTK